MSVFFCDSCDSLVDSDYAPEFIYYANTDTWKCQACIERDDEDDPPWVGFSNFINLK